MKLHADLVREILLAVEADDHSRGFVDLSPIKGYSDAEKGYHVLTLQKQDFIEAIISRPLSGSFSGNRPIRLTGSGHEFLENIRNPDDWRETKVALSEIGSWDLETFGILAKKVADRKIQDWSGGELRL